MTDKLERLILDGISKPTDRGQQKSIGPSQIGTCPLCIGETLALKLPEQYPDLAHEEAFGLGSWIGTAVHAYLEETLDIPGAIKEQKNSIFTLEGYGEIKGSTDFYHPKFKRIIDWKVLGKWSYDKLRLAYVQTPNRIPSTTYRVQAMLYAFGWVKAGFEVDSVSLCVIPKLSNNLADIRFFTETYNEEVAAKAIKRLEMIWRWVQEGKLYDLPSDKDDCYRCSRVLFRV